MPNDNDISRCAWANDALLIQYHDTIYGRPRKSDTALFAKFCLEGFQAGLSWRTVLAKQPAFERAFCGFDPWRCAELSDAYLDFLMQDASIIRNRRKIRAAVENARVFRDIQRERGTFSAYLWDFTGGGVIRETGKTRSELSDAVSKDLRSRGMTFVGTTIIYAYLQAVGVIDSHDRECFMYHENGK